MTRVGRWAGWAIAFAMLGCGKGVDAFKDGSVSVGADEKSFSLMVSAAGSPALKGSVDATVNGKKMKRIESGRRPTMRANTPDWASPAFELAHPAADKSGRTLFRLIDGKDVIEVEVSGFGNIDAFELVRPASLDGIGDTDTIVLRLRPGLAKWSEGDPHAFMLPPNGTEEAFLRAFEIERSTLR